MVRQDLVKYIEDAKKKGYSERQLYQHLVSHGIPRKDVEEAIKQQTTFPVRMLQAFNPPERIPKMPPNAFKPSQPQQLNRSGNSIKHRNPFLVLLFSIITMCIYAMYWVISTNLELKKNTKSAPSPWIWIVIVILSMIALGTMLAIGYPTNLTPTTEISTIHLVMLGGIFLINLILTFIFWAKYAKSLNELTGFSTAGAFLLMFFLFPIGIIIAQVQLNNKVR